MPTDAPTWNSAPAIKNGSSSASRIRSAASRATPDGVRPDVGEQQQELVAALAGEQVARARGASRRRSGDPAQQLVAGGVAEGVVDELEVVEVEVQQRDRARRAPRARQRELEVLGAAARGWAAR